MMIQMTAQTAVRGSDSHDIASDFSPTAIRSLFTSPTLGLNSSTHSFATITSDSAAGTKYTVRSARDTRTEIFDSTAARANATGFCTKIVATMSRPTFHSERQNTGSSVRISR